MVRNDGMPEVIETVDLTRYGWPDQKISIITSVFKIEDEIDGQRILKNLERYARNCYKSEDKITEGSAARLIRNAMSRGHFSVIEHEKVTVRVICDRGVTHQWVRHRIASYSQESTRYCNYGRMGFRFIAPSFFPLNSPQYEEWKKAITNATLYYLRLLKMGAKPEEARAVLPNSLKTEIIITHNIREWRHFFYLRCSVAAHPQIREIAVAILKEFKQRIPVLFDDFEIDEEKMIATTKVMPPA